MAKEKPKAGRILSASEMKKKYPSSGLASSISIMPDNALWLPSRNLRLNYMMGGGIPYGKILEVFGTESSGKSLVAKDFVRSAQYLDGIGLWVDAEQSFDPLWAEKNGLNLENIVIYPETSIEAISDWAADMAITYRSQLKRNEPIVLVTDSIAALDCEVNINSQQLEAKAEMGNRAKAIFKYLRIRNQLFAELGIILIFINQLRQKVGATQWEDPDTTPGGNAMKFYAHQRLAFFKNKQINIPPTGDGKIWVGNEVSVRMKKNKVAPPRASFKTEVYFHDELASVGFSRYHGLGELFDKIGVVERAKGSSHFYYKGNRIANGKDNFQQLIETDKDIRSKLLRAAGINTLSKTKRLIERVYAREGNRYPVK